MTRINLSNVSYIYFKSKGTCAIKAELLEERPKAVCFKVGEGKIWFPKSALINSPIQPNNLEVKRWFRFEENSYSWKLFTDNVFPVC